MRAVGDVVDVHRRRDGDARCEAVAAGDEHGADPTCFAAIVSIVRSEPEPWSVAVTRGWVGSETSTTLIPVPGVAT